MLLLWSLAACDDDPPLLNEELCTVGFEKDFQEDCVPILPAGECPAGTMPAIGETACRPVGWINCPAGFERDATGWGCAAILSATPCVGATKMQIGSTSCQPVGDCDAPFPPAGAALFVDDSYGAGQLDASHFSTVGAALAVASSGDLIAIESGNYTGSLFVNQAVTFVGRCAEQVVIVSPAGNNRGIQISNGMSIRVSGITLRNHFEAVFAKAGSKIELDGVIIEQAVSAGLVVLDEGSEVIVTDSVIRQVQPDTIGLFGWGAYVDRGRLEIRGSVIAENHGFGVAASGSTGFLQLNDSIVRETAAGSDDSGTGVAVQSGAAAVIERSLISGNRLYGVLVGSGERTTGISEATIRDTVIRDTQPGRDGVLGQGINVAFDGRVTATQVALVGNGSVGAMVEGGGAAGEMFLSSGVIRDGKPDGFGMASGAGAQVGGRLILTEMAIVHNTYHGLVAFDAGSYLEVNRSIVRDTQTESSSGKFGRGLQVGFDAHAVVKQSALIRNSEYGVFVSATENNQRRSRVELIETLVADTQPRASGFAGVGVALREGAHGTLFGCAILRNRLAGVTVSDSQGRDGTQTEALIEHSYIGVTFSHSVNGTGGGGIVSGGKLRVLSTVITDSFGYGIIAANPGCTATLTDVTIRNTFLETNPDAFFGDGLVIGKECFVDISRSEITGSARAGLHASGGAGLVEDTVIRANTIGVHTAPSATLVETEFRPPSVPFNVLVVMSSTQFVDNVARVGSGPVPIIETLPGLE